MSTTYTRPGRFPAASTRYGKPAAPVPVKFADPAEDGERDENGRRLISAALPAAERPATTVMPPPAPKPRAFTMPRPRPVSQEKPASYSYVHELKPAAAAVKPPAPKTTTPLPAPTAKRVGLAGPTRSPTTPAVPPRPRTSVEITPDDIPW